MRIGIIGINHKQASLLLREKIARTCNLRFAGQRILHPKLSYVLLSTCNRTELYFHASDLSEAHSYLLETFKLGSSEDLSQKVYSYFGINCFKHLASVTSGLDSAILGETEIQGQVKLAYQEAAGHRLLPQELHFLFQKSLKIGKEIRSHHVLCKGMPTLEETLYQVAQKQIGTLIDKKILFIGVSRINQTILSWFQKKKINSITYCNRSYEKIKLLDLPALKWEHKEKWTTFDLIILGTKAPHYLIDEVPSNLATKKLIVDLSVPRNVAPCIGEHPLIDLLNIDQLSQLTQKQQHHICELVKEIEKKDILEAVRRQSYIFKLKQLHKSRHVSYGGVN